MGRPKKKPSWPQRPTDKERAAQFEPPPSQMPEGLATSTQVAETGATPVDEEAEKSWADVTNESGPSPMAWGLDKHGCKTAGGPIQHSLCPNCIYLQHDACTLSMPESMRRNPSTTGCFNAKARPGVQDVER